MRTQYKAWNCKVEAHGESTNGFINRAISETMERDKADGE